MGRPYGTREEPRHREAYLYWFNLTEKGNTTTDAIKITAEHCGVVERAVWNWYRNFKWQERAEKRRDEIMKEVEKKENRTLAENRVSYLKILHKLLDDYIQDGLPAQIETIKDLDLVIKNCLVLQDSPTEVVKNKNTQTNINIDAEDLFDEDLMRQIVEEEYLNRNEEEDETEEEK